MHALDWYWEKCWIPLKHRKKRKRNYFLRFRTCARVTGHRLRFGETIDLSQFDTKLVLWMVAESKTIIDFGTRSRRALSFCMPRQRRIIFCVMLPGPPFPCIIIFVLKYSFFLTINACPLHIFGVLRMSQIVARAHLPRRFWSVASPFSMKHEYRLPEYNVCYLFFRLAAYFFILTLLIL